MDEGCQGLLVAAAAAEEEAIDWFAVAVRLHRQLITEQQSSYDTHSQLLTLRRKLNKY